MVFLFLLRFVAQCLPAGEFPRPWICLPLPVQFLPRQERRTLILVITVGRL